LIQAAKNPHTLRVYQSHEQYSAHVDMGLGFRFRELKGMAGMEAIPHLERAVAYLVDENNRPALLEMQPPNGWGTLETATEFLQELLAMCRSHPKAFIAMWH
jgi:4-aminobutyrate aminotransferase-like enzyme